MSDQTTRPRKVRLILGGTFDPIHWGHIRPALDALTWLAADELRLMPSAQPPHRDYPGATAEQRLAMATAVAAEFEQVVAEDWELAQSRPSYTAQTLAELKQRWPNDSLVFLLGDDAMASLNRWHAWQSLLDHAHFALLARSTNAPPWPPAVTAFVAQRWLQHPDQLRQSDSGGVIRIPNSNQPIAATEIRAAIQSNADWDHWVPSSVAAYIRLHGLYR